jgi:hypothetical protein
VPLVVLLDLPEEPPALLLGVPDALFVDHRRLRLALEHGHHVVLDVRIAIVSSWLVHRGVDAGGRSR